MDENALLRRVSVEPALYTFDPPRTIAATLNEYERHLGDTAGGSGHGIQATLEQLRDLLDPIEAPLVALTAGMARTLVATVARELPLTSGGFGQSLSRPLEAAWRFFCWAKERGYVGNNPFEPLVLGTSSAPHHGVASRRSSGSAARGWVA